MCTVIVRVEPGSAWPVTLLALRDESPDRPWDPPGAWWPERDASTRGVRDRSAGGAWLAASDRTGALAVVLNRDEAVPEVDGGWTTRGALPLDAVIDDALPVVARTPTTRAFNLLRASADGVTVTAWDGERVTTTALAPGVHMLTEGAPDDVVVPRIGRWLPAFRAVAAPAGPPDAAGVDAAGLDAAGVAAAGASGAVTSVARAADEHDQWGAWLRVLAETTALPNDDPQAVLRDNTGAEGRFATLSVVTAAVGAEGGALRHARLPQPGRIGEGLTLRPA